MTQLLSREFFQSAYSEMENDLKRRSENNSLCEYCVDKGIPSIFRPDPNQPPIQEVQKPHGRLSDLAAARKNCPFCRVLWRLMETGAGRNCCDGCRDSSMPAGSLDVDFNLRICPQPHRRVGVVAFLDLPDNSYRGYHVAHGDLHFVHPTQADHFRIREWIDTCDSSHASCTEHIRAPDGLFGLGKYALRLIDVELRMIVKSLRPVRYLTLSYVWGASANRKFDMIPNPYADKSRFPPGIEPVERQIPDMMFGRLSPTFEDLICFARRLGERYIWIDAICIPQDEPDILVYQLALMDQVYFHGVCNIVSLTSGVEDGLPGASSVTPRDTRQLVEQFSPDDGPRIATPLWELFPMIANAPWVTRGWTLQEHLLAKRSIFFAPTEVIFVCKEMSAKESWKYPRRATDIDNPNDPSERWYEYNIPLSSGTTRCDRGAALTSTLSTIVQIYTTRHLTYASDKYRAFQGLEARLSETYQVEFLHAHPLSKMHFPASLLWGRVDFRDGSPQHGSNQSTQLLEDLPSWSWLGQPSAVAYKYWNPWSSAPDFPLHSPLNLPRTQIHLKQQQAGDDNTIFKPLPDPSPIGRNAASCPPLPPSAGSGGGGSGTSNNSDERRTSVLKITGLSLDINPDDWAPSHRRALPNAMSLWENTNYSTPGRGEITFNLVVVPDALPADMDQGFPPGTAPFRLVYVGSTVGDGTGGSPGGSPSRASANSIGPDEDLKPKMPLLLRRGEQARTVGPTTMEDGETEYSRHVDWMEPDYSSKNNYLGAEPDVCLLVVEAVDDPTVVVKRLGIAFVRTMDFLIAGAKVREILLG